MHPRPRGHEFTRKRNADVSGLKILKKTRDMMLYANERLIQFPKYERDSLVRKMKETMYAIVDLIIEANYEADAIERLDILYMVNIELDKLRFFMRFSVHRDVRYLSVHQYGVWSAKVDEIGRMLGGWIGSLKVDMDD